MKPHVLYVYDPTTEEVVGALPSGDTGEPTEVLLIECPSCPTLVPWNSSGEYGWSLAGRNRRTATDDEGRVRPFCLSCSWEVTMAEEDARGARETAWADYERGGAYE